MKNIRHSVVLVAVVAFVTLAAPSVASTAGAATVPTRHLTASGGTIEWTTTVHNAQWCEWSSSPTVTGFDATVRCKSGTVTRSATFTANTSSAAKYYTLSLTVLGQTKTVEYLKVVEAPTGAGSTPAVPTRHLPASGGTIKWAVAVHSAKTCTWSSSPKVAGFDGTARCTNGLVVRAATFKANTSTEAKNYTLTLVVRGKTTTVEHLTVVEAGKLAGARKLATTTSLGIVSGSVTTGYVFGVHVTDSNGPVSLPTRSIVFQVTTNYPQTGTPWSWTATTRTANQSSCTLDLFRESSYLDLTSSDCSVSRSAKIILAYYVTTVTVQAHFAGTATDDASASFEMAWPVALNILGP
jgi:hypothetical protein